MATSLNERKIREGLELLKDAEKCLQTSWLKWKPDYDNAADKYAKAGTAFKVGKSYDQAKDAFLKAAEAHFKNNSLYHSGKALEQAGTMLKEMKRLDEAAELLRRAGTLFQQNGTPDSAAMVLIKAAKMCETTNQAKATELYQQAGELRELDDKLREAAEPYSKATQLLIKQQKFEGVVISMTKQLELYAQIGNSSMQYKVILGLIVVYLHEGHFVAADKCFKNAFDVPGFGTSDEAESIENLLEAYDQSDAEAITAIVSKPLFRHLDNELSKLARDLKPSEEFNISQTATELRVISSDVAKLKIDETKAAGSELITGKQGTRLPRVPQLVDDDEENPLGSEDSGKRLRPDELTTEETESGTTETGSGTVGNEDTPLTGELGSTPVARSDDSQGEETAEGENINDEGLAEEENLEEEGGLC